MNFNSSVKSNNSIWFTVFEWNTQFFKKLHSTSVYYVVSKRMQSKPGVNSAWNRRCLVLPRQFILYNSLMVSYFDFFNLWFGALLHCLANSRPILDRALKLNFSWCNDNLANGFLCCRPTENSMQLGFLLPPSNDL